MSTREPLPHALHILSRVGRHAVRNNIMGYQSLHINLCGCPEPHAGCGTCWCNLCTANGRASYHESSTSIAVS